MTRSVAPEGMRSNLKTTARAPQAPIAEPDPEIIWFFDSSKQLLVFRDTQSGKAAVWSESALKKSGWNMNGIRFLPRVSVQG